MTKLTELQDLRRDAYELLWTEIAQHIPDLAREDIPDESEIHILREDSDENKWTGIFQVETNLEKIYEIAYRYDTEKFYVTTYLMTFCNKYDPPYKY